ncbi:hypothetical protein H4R18_003824 [Coemansia javaensis]|uniref:PI31 proteasome regulator C-terminal domain-containing protein n=1 Tax=Coemansia javaensis TaxID=2761396 RepID=A0A9W8HAT7_9FUNG|nr:hypothetical protein H4R18_003824 [Coemansia javaensis]
MQADDAVIDAVRALVGSAPVQSAEDLVVALSQAVLGHLGFERPGGADAAGWESPGLPQGTHTARFAYVNGGDGQGAEARWVAMGGRVVLLVQQLPAGDTCTIQLPVADYVAPGAAFPCTVSGAPELEALLAPDAAAAAMAAIRAQLVSSAGDDDEARPPRAPPAPSLAAAGGYGADAVHGRAAPRGIPSVGRDDLDPLGLTRPGLGEGGMLVGPGHPMFQPGGLPLGPSSSGGPQPLPPGAVPPGARFDPITPQGAPGRRGGGRHFGGEPDPDALQPPHGSWNYDI